MAANAGATTVGDDDFARNGQPQTRTDAGLSGHAEEALKDAGLMFLGNPGALVTHAELNAVAFDLCRAHLDFGASWRMAEGVGNEVMKDVADPLTIHQHGRQPRLHRA